MPRPQRFLLVLLPAACALGADQDAVRLFETHVRPVLAERCYACHSERSPQPLSGLRVDSRAGLLRGGNRGPALVPGDPDSSRLIRSLRHSGEVKMPPDGKLTETQLGHLEAWVRLGAPFPEALETAETRKAGDSAAPHWAFVAPRAAKPPATGKRWAETAIDGFIEGRLADEGLEPSPEAPPHTLIRRLYYDLIGLPPSPLEVEAFARAPSAAAYEALVDALLASPHFGERWARHWLDLTRYADEGFQARPFPIAWTYRDWVVEAFNEDLPYDAFILRQLAADLIEGDRKHLAALGMLTVGINMVRPTELPENIDDRIDVVTRGFLGLSVACARCHDHKFDRIPQTDYYSLYGVFLNSPNVLEPEPIEAFRPGADTEAFRRKLARRRASLDAYRDERLAHHIREFREPATLARYLEAAWATRAQSNRYAETLSKEKDLNLYLLNRWRKYLAALQEPAADAFRELDSPGGAVRLASLMTEAAGTKGPSGPSGEALRFALEGPGSPTDIPPGDFWWVQNEGDSNVMKGLKWQYEAVMHEWGHRGGPKHAMVVREAPELQPAHVFLRGNQYDKGVEVPRRFLSALAGRAHFQVGSGRLELARAIAAEDNPLTARVLVNRVWERLFREGLVRTPSDFGVQGDQPSHPELLDHLAVAFMADGWSLKALIRRVVLSRAYRQASVDSAVGVDADPENRLLWRQNRARLDFEALRDSMLAVAGRLDRRVGGPPFDLRARPSAPRRTLYAYISREEPSALMRTFDFSNPEEHTPRRQLTTVPQQGLFLLNGPFLAEQAGALAEMCGAAADCVDELHRSILGRLPKAGEREVAADFVARSDSVAANPGASRRLPNPWSHGVASFDPVAGRVSDFQAMRYRVEDRVQPAPMLPARETGRAHFTPQGGFPGDDLRTAVVRRWTAPRDLRVSIQGSLNHPLGDQGRRFDSSNGVRGWIVSSRNGVLANWTVRGYEAAAEIRNLRVEQGEWLDFIVDARGDYESDAFRWTPTVEESLDAERKSAGVKPDVWRAADGLAEPEQPRLNSLARYAQVLLLTNEFAFRD